MNNVKSQKHQKLRKFNQILSLLLIFTMLLGSCPAKAAPVDIILHYNSSKDQRISPDTYSTNTTRGVDTDSKSQSFNLSSNVYSIKSDGILASGKNAIGIYTGGTKYVIAKSLAGGINLSSCASDIRGLSLYDSTGDTSISNISSINLHSYKSGKTGANVYGIFSSGGTKNISFCSSGGQAITIDGNVNTARSIDLSSGKLNVAFTDSILSGGIQNSGKDGALNLTFNEGGKWTPVSGDMKSGMNVANVIFNNGSEIDTRGAATGRTTRAKDNEYDYVDIRKANITANAGSKASFDADVTGSTLKIDTIKVQKSSTGTMELGTIDVVDGAASNWSGTKKSNPLFVVNVGETATTTGLHLNGSTETQTTYRRYKFTGNSDTTVNGEVVPYVHYTLPQTIQANPEKAGTADTYAMSEDEEMTESLGLLNNKYRTAKGGFTLIGNDHTLTGAASVVGNGVTINSSEYDDTMTVKDITLSGFDTFATNNGGTLNLEKVTFTGTTGAADVVNNSTLNLNNTASTFYKGIAGTGTTNVNTNTELTGSAKIEQKDVNIADAATLTVNANNEVNATGAVTVKGTGLTASLTATGLSVNTASGGTAMKFATDGINAGGLVISGVADGVNDDDAATVGQLKNASGGAPDYIAASKYNETGVKASVLESGTNAGGATALGYSTVANANYATAVGYGASATHANSVALGASSVTGGENEVSVGKAGDGGFTRKITNVTAGTADTDAANYGQLKSTYTSATYENNVLSLKKVDGTATNLTITGGGSGTDANAVHYDYDAAAKTGDNSVTLKDNQGTTSAAVKIQNVAAGTADSDAANVKQSSIYIGTTKVNNENGVKFTSSDGSVTFDAKAGTLDITASGGGTGGTDAQAVHYDYDGGTKTNKITLKGQGENDSVKITNLAEAELTNTSTDAVAGKQLNATNQKVAGNEAAISALQTTVTDYGKYITGSGLSGNGSRITNVADGTENSDAATFGQLKNYSAVKVTKGATVLTGNLTNASGIELSAGKDIEFEVSGNKLTIKSTAGGGSGTDDKAVHYDYVGTEKQNSVTLLDTNGGTTAQVAIKNVASAGTLSADNNNAATGADVYNAVKDKADKGTTLADYGITDAYSKNETYNRAEIDEKIGSGGALAVSYKDATKTAIELSGDGGTTISNVKAVGIAENGTYAATTGQLYDINKKVDDNAAALKDKADKSYVDTELAKKADAADLDKKADKSYVDNEVIKLNDRIDDIIVGEVEVIASTKADKVNDKAANAGGAGAVASGYNSNASGKQAAAMGYNSVAQADNSVAIGYDSAVSQPSTSGIAIGDGTKVGYKKDGSITAATNSVAIGVGSHVTGSNSIAIGTGHNVSGSNSGVFGDPSTVSGNNSYAIGNRNTIAQDNSFVLGNDVTTTQANSVVLGAGSTDRAATAGVGVVSVGAQGKERQIINVAPGELSATSTDAVNGSQLYGAYQAIETMANQTNEGMNRMSQQIASVGDEVQEVGAINAALAGLHYIEPSGDEGDKFAAAAAYGGYRGKSAAALGVAYRPSGNFMLSAATSLGNNHNTYNAGVSYKFGKGNTAATRAELQKQIKYVNEENMKLKEALKSVLERLDKLENKQ